MAYLVLTLDILVVCVLICSQTFIDNFAGSVGGNQLTKIKGHHCQQVEQMDTHMHTHTYINHSVHNYIFHNNLNIALFDNFLKERKQVLLIRLLIDFPEMK